MIDPIQHLRKLVVQSGLDAVCLSFKCGVNNNSIAKLARDKTYVIGWRSICKLAKLFKLTPVLLTESELQCIEGMRNGSTSYDRSES